MLSREDSVWLAREYPELTPVPHEVKGLLKFTDAYHEESGRFFILNDEPAHDEIGTVLSGAFEIKIRGRLGFEATSLPKVFVAGVPHTLDRHFYQNDFSACLCSPLQHQDFLVPEFNFRRFFNELVGSVLVWPSLPFYVWEMAVGGVCARCHGNTRGLCVKYRARQDAEMHRFPRAGSQLAPNQISVTTGDRSRRQSTMSLYKWTNHRALSSSSVAGSTFAAERSQILAGRFTVRSFLF